MAMHTLTPTPELRKFLDQHKITPKHPLFKLNTIKRIRFADTLRAEEATRHYCDSNGVLHLTSLGFGGYSQSGSPRLAELIRFGRYCSIAADVEVMGRSHPTDRVTTSLMTYGDYYRNLARHYGAKKIRFQAPFDDRLQPIEIGNDVWIGQNVLLKSGIRIGHGAIVAAGAIVVSDVEPYAIVGGTPARNIRHRFSDEMISDLLETQWWNYNIADLASLQMAEPEAFIRQFRDNVGKMTQNPTSVITADKLLKFNKKLRTSPKPEASGSVGQTAARFFKTAFRLKN